MRVAILASNFAKIAKSTKKGTEIFVYILAKELKHHAKKYNLDLSIFASGNSKLTLPVISVSNKDYASEKDLDLSWIKLYEEALISKAVTLQENFDIFHFNIGQGETILPFLPFLKKPVLVTMHGHIGKNEKDFISLFKKFSHIHFVSISGFQRKACQLFPYIKTIYHGIDTKRNFTFDPKGGNSIMWAGRAVPEKGLDVVLDVAQKTKKQAKIFPIVKDEFLEWLNTAISKKSGLIKHQIKMEIIFNLNRYQLQKHYQTSKLFLFPIKWEEAFGFVMAESLACGTPVIAYAKGSTPEIIKDGVTGYLVNSSPEDIRGDFIIKKTGVEGLCEAVEKIYTMSPEEYMTMRKACRMDAETRFSVDRMVKEYIQLYYQITGQKMPQDIL